MGGNGRKAHSVAAGGSHSCALLRDRAVKCWGSGLFGQLGMGTTSSSSLSWMGDRLPAVDLGANQRAKSLSAGDTHTCALLETGVLKCWGLGSDFRLSPDSEMNVGVVPGQMGVH